MRRCTSTAGDGAAAAEDGDDDDDDDDEEGWEGMSDGSDDGDDGDDDEGASESRKRTPALPRRGGGTKSADLRHDFFADL